MSRMFLCFRASTALALLLGVATLSVAQDKKKPAKKVGTGPKTVAMDSLDISGYPKFTATSRPGERGREQLEAVLAQFKVETNKRYLPRQGATFCNIYARDVCKAMNCTLPYGRLANQIYDWLPSKAGKAAGWVAVTPDEAQRLANEGRPVVVSYKNPGKIKVKGKDGKVTERPAHGHIAMVRPSDQPGGPWLSHAGSRNSNHVPVNKVFSAARMKTIRYYANK